MVLNKGPLLCFLWRYSESDRGFQFQFIVLPVFDIGHPNKMFRFPSPYTRKVGSVGRIKKKKSKNNFKVNAIPLN